MQGAGNELMHTAINVIEISEVETKNNLLFVRNWTAKLSVQRIVFAQYQYEELY